jgi:hypothetical protein
VLVPYSYFISYFNEPVGLLNEQINSNSLSPLLIVFFMQNPKLFEVK